MKPVERINRVRDESRQRRAWSERLDARAASGRGRRRDGREVDGFDDARATTIEFRRPRASGPVASARPRGRRSRRWTSRSSLDRPIDPVNIPTLRERRGRRVKTHRRCSWWHPRCSRSHRTRRGTASRPRRRRQPVDGERRGARRSANEVRDIIYSLEPQLEGLFSDRSAPSHPSRGDARGRSTRRRATETSASMCSRDAAGEFSRARASRSP